MNPITEFTLKNIEDKFNMGLNEDNDYQFNNFDTCKIINEINSETVVIVYGLGNGEWIQDLIKKFSPFNSLIIFEPDEKKLFKIVSNKNIFKLLQEKQNISLCIPNDNLQIRKTIYYHVKSNNFNNVKVYINSGYEYHFGNKIKEFLILLRDIINNLKYDFYTGRFIGSSFFNSYIKNIKQIIISQKIDVLRDNYKNVPAIIVSAGPSLKKNIEQLKELQKYCIIITGPRTLKPLLELEIKPDFLVALDTGDEMYEMVKDVDYSSIPLVYTEQTNNKLVSSHKGIKIFYRNPAVNTYIQEILEENISNLYTGGSVAHSATDFARFIGCDPIIFVGQDLAFTNNETYAFKNYGGEYSDEKLKVIDIFGKEIYTSISLNNFKLNFEIYIAINKNNTFINSTEGGANINGTLIMPLNDIYELVEMVEKNILNNKINLKEVDIAGRKEKAQKKLDLIVNKYNELIKLSDEVIDLCYKTEVLTNQNKAENNLKRIYELNKIVEETREIEFVEFISQNVFNIHLVKLQYIDYNEKESFKKIVSILRELYSDIKDILEIAIKQIDEIKKDINNI